LPDEFLTLIIAVASIGFGILALEVDNLSHSVIFLWLSSVFTGLLFFAFGAYYAAILQFIVYSGVLAILFLVFIGLADEVERESLDEWDKPRLTHDDVVIGGQD
jgi:NADH:ubiquinone oxidoreductase subunit 6 (subunit J)